MSGKTSCRGKELPERHSSLTGAKERQRKEHLRRLGQARYGPSAVPYPPQFILYATKPILREIISLHKSVLSLACPHIRRVLGLRRAGLLGQHVLHVLGQGFLAKFAKRGELLDQVPRTRSSWLVRGRGCCRNGLGEVRSYEKLMAIC